MFSHQNLVIHRGDKREQPCHVADRAVLRHPAQHDAEQDGVAVRAAAELAAQRRAARRRQLVLSDTVLT